jgi:hypothetical protein
MWYLKKGLKDNNKESHLKCYKVTTLPVSLYGSESWTLKARGINGFTRLGHIKNKDIRKELKIQRIQNKIDQHTQNI